MTWMSGLGLRFLSRTVFGSEFFVGWTVFEFAFPFWFLGAAKGGVVFYFDGVIEVEGTWPEPAV